MIDLTGDTIAAVSTPVGKGGIGIIRISGPEAFAAAKKIFRASLSSNADRSAEVFDALPSHSLRHGGFLRSGDDSGNGGGAGGKLPA